MSQTAQTFALTVQATGEVRDADGNLVETVTGPPTTVEVSVDDLRGFTDDQLRLAGLDEHTITEIRSTP